MTVPPHIPSGKGVYLRDDLARDPIRALTWLKDAGMKWAAINVAHERLIRATLAAGMQAWVFQLPGKFDDGLGTMTLADDEWRQTIAKMVAVAKSTGATGVLVDPEMGWAKSTKQEREAFVNALLGVRIQGLGVGVTTHDGLRAVAGEWSKKLGPAGCWGSPQVYDHQMGAPLDRPARVVAEWDKQRWAAVIPSVGSFGTDDASFRAYFAALPNYEAGALWYTSAPKGPRLEIVRDVWRCQPAS